LSRFQVAAGRTFHSLRVRNYRLYFFGQTVSLTGTWMQSVAQAWLVLKLTGSGFAVGLVTGLQFLPILLLGSWGGLIADRMDKRRVLLVTQSLAALLALTLGLGLMHPGELRRQAPVPRSKGQVREGCRYVLARAELTKPLLLMAVAGTLAYNFSILIPLMTQFVFHAGAGAYGVLFSLMG